MIWTAPHGHTHATHPGSRLFLPTWNTTTAELPEMPSPTDPLGDRCVMMPRRRRTRAADQTQRIKHERALNDAHVAERNRPPPF